MNGKRTELPNAVLADRQVQPSYQKCKSEADLGLEVCSLWALVAVPGWSWVQGTISWRGLGRHCRLGSVIASLHTAAQWHPASVSLTG